MFTSLVRMIFRLVVICGFMMSRGRMMVLGRFVMAFCCVHMMLRS
jgi:hypothetical protein